MAFPTRADEAGAQEGWGEVEEPRRGQPVQQQGDEAAGE